MGKKSKSDKVNCKIADAPTEVSSKVGDWPFTLTPPCSIDAPRNRVLYVEGALLSSGAMSGTWALVFKYLTMYLQFKRSSGLMVNFIF